MRSRTRLTVLTLACVATAALALSLTHAGEKDGYTVSLLANPYGAPYTYANDVNDSGRIVGAHEFQANGIWVQEALLWKKWNCDPVVLPPLEGHTDTNGMAINNTGESCGYSTDWRFYQNAVIWDEKGNVTDMHPDLGQPYSQMWDINQYGDAVGVCYGFAPARAFISPVLGDPEFLELDTTVYGQSWPFEISKDGVVVGFARPIGGYTHACYWDEDGDFDDLHDDIEADLGYAIPSSKAWAITDKGEIGGVAVVAIDANGVATDLRPFVWTEEGGFTWVDDAETGLAAIGGSAGKRMVGVVGGSLQLWNDASVGVWTRTKVMGKTVWALECLPKPEDITGMVTWGASTSGRVAGVATDDDGYWYAFYADK